MKDTQTDRPKPGAIPILSPVVHCIAMTALVYLRSSFGYIFLRPKSVFFAFSWAMAIFAYIAWHEPSWWPEYRALCMFGAGAVILYWLHLVVAVSRELYRSGAHDHYSGTSHLLRFVAAPSEQTEMNLHMWAEPVVTLLVSAVLRLLFGEHHLSTWLAVTAAAMVCKEGINYWAAVRREKIKKDMLDDAVESGQGLPTNRPASDPPKATRKEPVKQPRNTASAEEKARERRFAELLRLRPSYTREKAEENYVTLIKLEHPDATGESPEANSRAADLNEAIEYFRERLP